MHYATVLCRAQSLLSRIFRLQPQPRLMQREKHRSPPLQLLLRLFIRSIYKRFSDSDQIRLHFLHFLQWDGG
jgi:hypothetical protein